MKDDESKRTDDGKRYKIFLMEKLTDSIDRLAIEEGDAVKYNSLIYDLNFVKRCIKDYKNNNLMAYDMKLLNKFNKKYKKNKENL